MIDPKAPAYKEATSNGGFVLKPAMFTVTDDLGVTPISPISGLSILNRLKVPFSDIEERIVHMGNEEVCSTIKFEHQPCYYSIFWSC